MLHHFGPRLAVALACLAPALALADTSYTYDNLHPEIQMWSYPAGSANGVGAVRDRGATFAAYSYLIDGTTPGFYPGNGVDPSRRGTFLIAADTAAAIPVGLDPDRYRIDSLRVTSTLLGALIYEPDGRVLPYDNTLDDALSLTTGGDSDPGRPIELYGIGLQGDYETIGFDKLPTSDPVAGVQIENAFQLGDVRWRRYREGEEGYDPSLSPSAQATAPYQFFAVDAAGRDVENSVAGGYSATEPTGTTSQFTPEPFAIGKVYDASGVEYSPGTYNDQGDVFVFEPDLSDSRILQYVQRSIASGYLGFSFSSMHEPSGHTGSVAYPDFYLDDLDVGDNPDGAAPTIELVVTILDAPLPGDYDGNGLVDQADLAVWTTQYGGSGPQADGNGDGLVDAADYTVWRDQLQLGSFRQSFAVPEPQSGQLVGIIAFTSAFFGWMRWYLGPFIPDEEADD